MKYYIKEIHSYKDSVKETKTTFFLNEKDCRVYWVKLLREHFLVQCCEDGKFMSSNFHEMATKWTFFFNYMTDDRIYISIEEIKNDK